MSRCKSYQKLVSIIAPQLVRSVSIFVDQKCLLEAMEIAEFKIEQDLKQRFGIFPCPHDQDVGVTTTLWMFSETINLHRRMYPLRRHMDVSVLKKGSLHMIQSQRRLGHIIDLSKTESKHLS